MVELAILNYFYRVCIVMQGLYLLVLANFSKVIMENKTTEGCPFTVYKQKY